MIKAHPPFCRIFLLVTVLFTGVNATLQGRVTDKTGVPIAEATLWVLEYDVFALTNIEGTFQFSQIPPDVSVQHHTTREKSARPFIKNGIVHFSSGNPRTQIRLELFDLTGRCIGKAAGTSVHPTGYRCDLSRFNLPASTCLLSCSDGTRKFIQPVVFQRSGGIAAAGKMRVRHIADGAAAVARNASEIYIDDLICSAAGFEPVTIPLTTYDQTINIVMEAEDTVPPVITILEGDTVRIPYDDEATISSYWMDYRIEVTDDRDTAPAIYPPTHLLIDKEKPSFAVITYQARDRSGNLARAYRYLILYDPDVVDTTPPVITVDPDTIFLFKGEIFHDTGVAAFDEVDSNLTGIITKKGVVNPLLPGTYTVTYRVIDTSLNETFATRTVIVLEREEEIKIE